MPREPEDYNDFSEQMDYDDDQGEGNMGSSDYEGIKVGNMMIYPTRSGGMQIEWDNEDYYVDK